MIEPELKNWDEIANRLQDGGGESIQRAVGKALQNITLGIVNARHSINALMSRVGDVNAELKELNANIKSTSNSSDELTRAIKKITFWGTIIAGCGVGVAFLALLLDFYKTFLMQ